MLRILPLLMLPLLCLAQSNSNVVVPNGGNTNSVIQAFEIKRKATFNLEEIKVRWKKAALENCTGVPCVTAPSFTCGTSTISDIDGNSYNTVLIGTQCWTNSNLKVTKYNDDTLIPDLTNSSSSPWAPTSGARTGYIVSLVSLDDYVGTLGYLYNWYATIDSRKLCPAGWHVPTDSDWNKLVISIHSGADTITTTTSHIQSTSAGTLMKSNKTNMTSGAGLGWDPGSPGTNTSGFSALPGGYRQLNGQFLEIRENASFWSATEHPTISTNAYFRELDYGGGNVDRKRNFKDRGFSVRCLRD